MTATPSVHLDPSDSRWHQIFDALEEPVLVVDAKERVVDLNRAALEELQCDAGSARFLSLADLPEEPWRGCRALARVVRLRGSERERELREARTGRHWSIRCSFIDSPQSEETARQANREARPDDSLLLLVLRETTEYHLLRDAMRQYEKASWFANIVGGLAHHVNNPLFAISVTVELLKGRLADCREETEMLTTVLDEVGRLAGLMRSLVEFSSVSCRQRGRHEVASLVQEACSSCGLTGAGQPLRVEMEIERGVEALVDRDALRLALVKVLENSRDLSPTGSTIWITGRHVPLKSPSDTEADPTFELRIRDQGPGIAPAHRRQVFEPFFSRRSGHYGLGLALAERILISHGGSMACEECRQGSSLVLRLPVAFQRSDLEESM